MKPNSDFKAVAVHAANGECSSNECEGGWGSCRKVEREAPHPGTRRAYESLDYWWQTSRLQMSLQHPTPRTLILLLDFSSSSISSSSIHLQSLPLPSHSFTPTAVLRTQKISSLILPLSAIRPIIQYAKSSLLVSDNPSSFGHSPHSTRHNHCL